MMLMDILHSTIRVIGLFIVLGVWFLAGCNSVPPEYQAFFDLSPEQRREKMEQFPIDKQIDYYLAGMTYTHPPLRLASHIAKQGKKAIPFLMKRLEEEDKEFRQIAIMEVFEDMNRFYYSLKGEKEAIELLKEVTANMKNPNQKARAEDQLNAILSDQPPDPKNKLDKMVEEETKP